MRNAPFRYRPRAVLLVGLSAAITVPMLAVAWTASAEEPSDGQAVVGTLVQAWTEQRQDVDHAEAEPAAEVDAQLLSWVDPVRGDSVRVPTGDLPELDGLAPGATLEVTVGDEVADEATGEGLDSARELLDVEVLAAAPPLAAASTGTTNEVTVVMVRPGGIAAPVSGPQLQDVVGAVDGPVATFWSEQSDGAIQLEVTGQHDWIPTTATCANPELLFQQVESAVNWSGGDGQHLLLYLPPNAPGCEDGLATVGTGVDGGGYLYVSGVRTSLVAHEFGHNFSLGHAAALQCDGSIEAGTCGLFPYWDLYDVMGLSWAQLGSLNAPHADRLGLLDDLSVEDFSVFAPARTVSVYAQDQVGVNGGLRLVEPVTDLWTGVEYWLEYRYPRGRDAWLGTVANEPDLDTGVLLRIAQDGSETSLLLDGTPSAEAGWANDLQAALPLGTPVPVAGGAFLVTVESVGTFSASVRVEPQSPIVAAYDRTGGAGGPLGARWGDLTCLPDGGCYQAYEQGSIYWSVTTGTHAMLGAIYDKWVATGSELSLLGYPTSDQVCGLPDGGCFQRFEGGRIYWSSASGARVVQDEIFGPWGQRSYERGLLGYPVADTVCGLRDGGCFQRFQGGSLYASRVGTGAVKGAIFNRWAAGAWERGRLGYPRGDEVCSAGRCIQQFQGGRIASTSLTGARAVFNGAIGGHWGSGFASPQGFPTADERCGLVRGGCFQPFQFASIYWSSATGAQTVGLRNPQIRSAWAAQGWERGTLGYPSGPETKLTYGWSQRFQGGTLTWDRRTNRVTRR